MSDTRSYGEVFHAEYAAAQRRFMRDSREWGDLSPTEQGSIQAGAVAVAEDVQRRGFAARAEPEAERYALVEMKGYRRLIGTVRDTVFCGKPMIEVHDLETGKVHLANPDLLFDFTWLTRDQAERASRTGAHSVAAISAGQRLAYDEDAEADEIAAEDDPDLDDDGERDTARRMDALDEAARLEAGL